MAAVVKPQNHIDDHIAFLTALREKYGWEDAVWQDAAEELAFIEAKRADKTLNLSVIGEFSSGKSTFINALLRDELLETANEQGTTVAATIIRYAPRCNVIVYYKDSGREELEQKSRWHRFIRFVWGRIFRSKRYEITPERIRDYLSRVTADPVRARDIKEIVIEHPAEFLKSGISIIDTPGTNSLESWHDEVTKTAIRERSDVSAILTSASQAMPKTLNEFIAQNLSDILNRCVFVVTKMDMFSKKEWERLLTYIGRKITDEFGVHEPAVFPYTPLFVLGEASEAVRREILYPGDDYNALIEQSYQTEDAIRRLLETRRESIQNQKLLSIMDSTFSNLSAIMKDISDSYQRTHDALAAAQKRDLAEFGEEMWQKYHAMFWEKVEDLWNEVFDGLSQMHESMVKRITDIFWGCQNAKELYQFCGNPLTETLRGMSEQLMNEARIQWGARIGAHATCIQDAFWEAFKKEYEALEALGSTEDRYRFKSIDSSLSDTDVRQASSLAVAYKRELKGRQKTASAVGMGIGGMLFGEQGMKIGYAIGNYIGELFSPRFSTIQKKMWEEIVPAIDEYFEKVFEVIEREGNEYVEQKMQELQRQIANCIKVYHKLVEKMRAEDDTRKAQLEQDISTMQRDLQEIALRKQNVFDALHEMKLQPV